MSAVRDSLAFARSLALTILLTLGISTTQAQTPNLPAPFGECHLGYWTSTRNLDDKQDLGSAYCALNWKPRFSEHVGLAFNLRLGWYDSQKADSTRSRFREAYLDLDRGTWSLRLGRQMLAWGRADRINPTDFLSPKDFTLLSLEDEDQRLGIDAARLRYTINPQWSVSGVVAQFTPHITPQGALPTNLVKATDPAQSEFAVRLDRSGEGWDGSLTLFKGYERQNRYRLDLSQPKLPVFVGDYERSQAIGLDLASAQGSWTWRAEFSHTRLSPHCDNCPQYQRRVTRAVIGADRDFADTMNLNIQLFANRRPDYQLPAVTPPNLAVLSQGLDRLNTEYAVQENGMTIRLSDRILNDKLKWEVSTVFDFTGKSKLVRPRVSYAVNDHLKLSAGLDLFSGEPQSFFGALKRNRTAFVVASVIF